METTNEKIIIDLELMIKIEPLLLMCPNYPKKISVLHMLDCESDAESDVSDDDGERATKRQKLGMW